MHVLPHQSNGYDFKSSSCSFVSGPASGTNQWMLVSLPYFSCSVWFPFTGMLALYKCDIILLNTAYAEVKQIYQ